MVIPPTPFSPSEHARLEELYSQRLDALEESSPGFTSVFQSLSEKIARPGELVVPPLVPDRDLSAVLAHGQFHEQAASFVEGAPSACHENSANLFATSAARAVATGYALGPSDTLWRPHSVAIGSNGIIETTVPRTRYFVATLSTLGSWAFAFSNLDPAYITPPPKDTLASLLEAIESVAPADGSSSILEALGPLAWET